MDRLNSKGVDRLRTSLTVRTVRVVKFTFIVNDSASLHRLIKNKFEKDLRTFFFGLYYIRVKTLRVLRQSFGYFSAVAK